MRLFFWLVKRWGPAFLMMGLIFYASSIPSAVMPNAGSWDVIIKKGGHITGYALLFLSIFRGLGGQEKRYYILALGACLLYALSDEFHQSFVAGRSATLTDVGIDMLGSTFSLWLCWHYPTLRLRVIEKYLGMSEK
jgi:VanZ family protein